MADRRSIKSVSSQEDEEEHVDMHSLIAGSSNADVSLKESPSNDSRKSSEDAKAAQRSLRTRYRSCQGHGILEIAALLTSIVAMIAIVLLVYSYDKHPINSWSFPTSLNTVVSVFGTISRLALALAVGACLGQQKWIWFRKFNDSIVAFARWQEATYSSWGSAKFLFSLKARHRAAVGAVVVIILPAFDPFLQAIVTRSGRLVTTPDSQFATIWRTERLDRSAISTAHHGTSRDFPTSAGNVSLSSLGVRTPMSAVAAVMRGFSGPDPSVLLPRATCTTGNCTWPIYPSLAYCTACNDISSFVSESHGTTSDRKVGSDIVVDGNHGIDPKNFTRYTLPYSNLTGWDGLRDHVMPNPWISVAAVVDPAQTLTFQNLETLIASFAIMRATGDFILSKKTWQDSKPWASECALWYCVNAYDTSSHSGNISERVVRSWAQRVRDSYQPTGESASSAVSSAKALEIYASQTRNQLSLVDFDVPRSDLQLSVSDDGDFDLAPDTPRRFNVTQEEIQSLSQFLLDWSVPRFRIGANITAVYTELMASDAASNLETMPSLASILWYSTDYNTTFDNLARSMTLDIRQTAAVPQQGALHTWVISYNIRWKFITVPVIAILGGLFFVITTVLENRRFRIPWWRADALPALAYGLSEESQEKLRIADVNGKMEAEAEQVNVCFPPHSERRFLEVTLDKKGRQVDQNGSRNESPA